MPNPPKSPINKPIDPADCIYIICLAHPCGGESLDVGRAELDRYNADPDGYAAEHFGFDTAEQYREWIRCKGTALCSERTKAGRLCRVSISKIQQDPAIWKEQHRSRACAIHANAGGQQS
jgi:hypothetical protein